MAAPRKNEVTFRRTLAAPRHLIFQIWTDPRHVAQWWGPHGFKIPRCELDVRPGGAILIDMRGPDGNTYPMHGVYDEVIVPERLAYTTSAMDTEGNFLFDIENVVTFTEHHGDTVVTVTLRVLQETNAAAPYLDGMEIGWEQQLERLEAFTASRLAQP